jgi:hypothetical protein
MPKFRPDTLSLFYFKDGHEADSLFNELVLIDDAICKAKNLKTAKVRLQALLEKPLHDLSKEFIRRLLRLHSDRLKRTSQAALRRTFTSTHHYKSALINRTSKARAKNKTQEKKAP